MQTFEQIKKNETVQNLSFLEIDAILKFPVYVSILAANGDGSLDPAEKMSAVHIAHIKTFSCDKILVEYFNEVNKVFLMNLEEVDKKLPKDKEGREIAIRHELQHLSRHENWIPFKTKQFRSCSIRKNGHAQRQNIAGLQVNEQSRYH